MTSDSVKEYIRENFKKCVRFSPDDDGTLIGLPYPYIVPSPDGHFQEMYYWDTFFTCKGLYLSGYADIAKNCTDDMLYLVEKYGFMPNGNRTYYLGQSQPPFLSMMVRDVYEKYGDTNWLKKAYETLKKEYNFWQTKRITPAGLNRFGVNMEYIDDCEKHYNSICKRLNFKVECKSYEEFAKNFLSDCESGWDFNPRCNMKQSEYVFADLNSNLYIYEKNFEHFANVLKMSEEKNAWREKAEKRKNLMNKILWNKTAYYDFNFVQNSFSQVFSAASFYPLWAKIADGERARLTVERLSEIEFEHGISACAKNVSPCVYQWDYPNGWAPLNYIVICALDNYGYKSDAVRIAQKYTSAVEKLFEKTGTLWEKYNVLTGDTDTKSDYESRVMLGWTAGVYLFAEIYLRG